MSLCTPNIFDKSSSKKSAYNAQYNITVGQSLGSNTTPFVLSTRQPMLFSEIKEREPTIKTQKVMKNTVTVELPRLTFAACFGPNLGVVDDKVWAEFAGPLPLE